MKKPIKALADTHAFLWAGLDDARLGPKARRLISMAGEGEIGISDVTLQEIGQLLHNDRISIPGHPGRWLEEMLRHITLVPISAEVAILAPALRLEQADPFDRIIVATARTLGVPLMTRDARIVESGLVRIVW